MLQPAPINGSSMLSFTSAFQRVAVGIAVGIAAAV